MRKQIRHWLEDNNGRERLLEESIPQKGLDYTIESTNKGPYYIATVDPHVNNGKDRVIDGTAQVFFSGYSSILCGVDFRSIKYFLPVSDHQVKGYYKVLSVEAADLSVALNKDKEDLLASGKKPRYKGYDKPFRICLALGEYTPLETPFVYGLDRNAAIGTAMTKKEFDRYCSIAKDKL